MKLLGWSLFWMTVLTPLCWMVSGPYQRALASVVESCLALTGSRVSVFHLQVYAPGDLGLFIAMCLASRQRSSNGLMRTMVLGTLLLVGVEVVVIVLSALPIVLLNQNGAAAVASRFTHYSIQSLVWVSAPSAWLLLLGPSESSQRPMVKNRYKRGHGSTRVGTANVQ